MHDNLHGGSDARTSQKDDVVPGEDFTISSPPVSGFVIETDVWPRRIMASTSEFGPGESWRLRPIFILRPVQQIYGC